MSSVYSFLSLHKEYNDFSILVEAFRQLLSFNAADKCRLYSYRTSAGSLSLVLEARTPGHSELCREALEELHSAPTFEISFLNIFENYIQKTFKKVQDKLVGFFKSIPGRITGSLKGRVGDLDKKLDERRKKNSGQANYFHFCYIVVVVMSMLGCSG